MNDKRLINEILKNYGKELHKARINFVESQIPVRPAAIHRISYRHMMKRCLITALILVMTLALATFVASALGIKFLNLNFIETKVATEITTDEGTKSEREEVQFYRPAYIPEGYVLVEADVLEGEYQYYGYLNDQKDILIVSQNHGDSFSANIDAEDCSINTETILDMEVRIWRYEEPIKEGRCTYLFRKEDVYVMIISSLPDDEIKKIIYNLEEKEE